MIRVVLVGRADDDWRLYRQPQWMAEVRRSPDATRLPRAHFDVPDESFPTLLESWVGSSQAAARDHLIRHGSVEVVRPERPS